MIACAHEPGQRKKERKCLQAASMDDAAATHSCTPHGPQTLIHMIHFGKKVFCQSGMLMSTTTRKV